MALNIKKTPFRAKIYIGILGLLLLQGIVMFLWVGQVLRHSLVQEIKNHGQAIGVSLSARVVEPLLANDPLRMKVLMDQTVELDSDIYYAFVLDTQDKPLIHTFENGFPIQLIKANSASDNPKGSFQLIDTGKQILYDYAAPVFVDKNRIGTLRLGLLQTRAQKAARKVLVSAVVTIVLAVCLAGVVGTLLLNPLTRSIKKLNESTEKALKGDLDVLTAPSLARNCWDIMKCGRRDCPAFENYRHRCWFLAGTQCPNCVHGEYAKKIDSCSQCRVYQQCSGDEIQSLAERFDAMALSLKDNMHDLKGAEDVLNEQRMLLQTILDAVPDFISLQNHEGKFISVNKAFCEMLGKSQEELLGKTNIDLFPEKFAEIYNEEDRKLFETGKAIVKENRIKKPDGVKWLHVVKIPVPAPDGVIRGLVCSGRDITKLKSVQEQLTQAQKMESIGRLAAGVAHEINTPLGIILGYAQLLLEDLKQDEPAFKDVQTIVRQTKNCSKIVKDLLNFSRSSERVVSRFDINEAVKEVIDVIEHTFNLNQVHVLHHYDAGKEMSMTGDKEKIKQVFINLMNNAFDAIMEDGQIVIETHWDKTGNNIDISISDTGHGISRENIDKIFEPFYTTKAPDKGTGLGLSVTFGIIKEHGGTIKAFSPTRSGPNEGKGTQFIISLPQNQEFALQ